MKKTNGAEFTGGGTHSNSTGMLKNIEARKENFNDLSALSAANKRLKEISSQSALGMQQTTHAKVPDYSSSDALLKK